MPANAALNGSLLDLVLQAGLVAKVVLAILALLSILSWALIVEKWLEFRRVRRESMRFLGVFRDKVVREARSLGAALGAAKRHRESPLAQLYVAACHEAGAGDGIDHGLEDWEEGAPPERLEAANRAMRRAAAGEVARLERHLPFLATTASAAPFIGLFGTVWGVMAAFHGIGQQGSASLAVVAPGISEALIATAAGLGAAIPAVMGYNFFVNRVKHWATEMEGFTLDLLNLLARPAPKGARVSGKDGL